MTLSRSYTFPGSSFPYVPGLISVTAFTKATAGTTRVPEPSSFILLIIALAGITAVKLLN
jgi:hypothetical protein